MTIAEPDASREMAFASRSIAGLRFLAASPAFYLAQDFDPRGPTVSLVFAGPQRGWCICVGEEVSQHVYPSRDSAARALAIAVERTNCGALA
jgi:hypothetical protein